MVGHKNDDELSLSSTALNALKEFYAERDARAEQFAKLQARVDAVAGDKPLSMDAFAEDWNESQFWYAEETAGLYAKLLLEGATENTTIAVVSAPSVFVALKNALSSAPPERPKPNLILLEHDQRFAIFPEFVYYDYAQPLKLPAHLKGTCDRIIVDPPFLSEDCQTKEAITVRWLSRPPSASPAAPDQSQGEPRPQPLLIVSTGERMKDIVTRVYRPFGLRATDYEPKHMRGLSNEFYCYANFKCDSWGWRE